MPEPLPADSDRDGHRGPDCDPDVDPDCDSDVYGDSDAHADPDSDREPLCTGAGGRASVPDAYAATAGAGDLERRRFVSLSRGRT